MKYRETRNMKMLALADGSLVPLVDVKRPQIYPHFFSRDKYYVQIETRDGGSRDVIEQLSRNAARDRHAEISRSIEDAWAERDPYDYGISVGTAEGRSEGYSTGFAAGKSEGRCAGQAVGFEECRRSILSYLFEMREGYMCELTNDPDLPPSSRRFLRNGITVLTKIIGHLSAEPA
jgi:hypothetical protein